MHEHASKMELGDKETVAICIQASVTCYLHVIHSYTCMVRTIRVWSYRTRMVYKIVPYTYGTYRIAGIYHESFKFANFKAFAKIKAST